MLTNFPQTRWFLLWVWRFAWRFFIIYTAAVVILVLMGWGHRWQLDIASALIVGVTFTWTLARAGDPDGD